MRVIIDDSYFKENKIKFGFYFAHLEWISPFVLQNSYEKMRNKHQQLKYLKNKCEWCSFCLINFKCQFLNSHQYAPGLLPHFCQGIVRQWRPILILGWYTAITSHIIHDKGVFVVVTWILSLTKSRVSSSNHIIIYWEPSRYWTRLGWKCSSFLWKVCGFVVKKLYVDTGTQLSPIPSPNIASHHMTFLLWVR